MKKLIVASLACAAGLYAAAACAEPGELWAVTSKTEMPNMPMAIPSVTMQICLPKNGARDPRKSMPNKDCKMTDFKRSGNKTTWKMHCNQEGTVMDGHGEFTYSGSGYKGVTYMKGNSHGQNIDMTTHYTGKKLGKSCDASKPTGGMAETAKPAAKSSGNSSSSGNALEQGAQKLKGLFGL